MVMNLGNSMNPSESKAPKPKSKSTKPKTKSLFDPSLTDEEYRAIVNDPSRMSPRLKRQEKILEQEPTAWVNAEGKICIEDDALGDTLERVPDVSKPNRFVRVQKDNDDDDWRNAF